MPKKKRSLPKIAPVVPRLGPPTNVRPGGPHDDHAEKKRETAIRDALRRGDADDDAL
jgi:hypothetical protein